MANDLQTRQEAAMIIAAPAHDAVADWTLSRSLSGSYRDMGKLVMLNPPGAEGRKTLMARRDTLLKSLEHDRKQVIRLVTEMLEGYRHRGVRANEDASAVLKVYQRELALDPKIPTWAVWRACSAIRMGTDPKLAEAGITSYEAPTTMALRKLCDSLMWQTRAELGAISDVLSGIKAQPDTPPEVREKVAKEFRALADEMKDRRAGENRDGPAPLSRDQLVELAGGEEVFAEIPNAKDYRKPKTMAELLPADAKAAVADAANGDVERRHGNDGEGPLA
jgi:hypothetical protein